MRRQELQGDEALELEVLSFVDDAHAAGPDFLDDAVLAGDDSARPKDANGSLEGLG